MMVLRVRSINRSMAMRVFDVNSELDLLDFRVKICIYANRIGFFDEDKIRAPRRGVFLCSVRTSAQTCVNCADDVVLFGLDYCWR